MKRRYRLVLLVLLCTLIGSLQAKENLVVASLKINEIKIGSIEEHGTHYLYIKEMKKVRELFHTSFSFSHRSCEKNRDQLSTFIQPRRYTHQGQIFEIKNVVKSTSPQGGDSNEGYVALIKNGIDTLGIFRDSGSHVVEFIQGFTLSGGQWALELRGQLFLNGRDLGAVMGYNKVFNYCRFQGAPFYFYEKGGYSYLHWNGKTYPQRYDKIHHYGCCDYHEYNPRVCMNHINFFAKRDGNWYWVTVERE